MHPFKKLVLTGALLVNLFGVVHAASIKLYWDEYSNEPGHLVATQINVYRRLDLPGAPYTAMPYGQVPLPGTMFTDEGVVNNQGYCYRITAYNPDIPFAESVPSNEVCAFVPLPEPPHTPTGLSVLEVLP